MTSEAARAYTSAPAIPREPPWSPAALMGWLPGLQASFTGALPAPNDAWLLEAALAVAESRSPVPLPSAIILAQHHSDLLLDLTAPDATVHTPFTAEGRSMLAYDGTVAHAGRPALLLVKTADCMPVLAADAETGHYAALHAGWRGAAAGILPRLLERWRAAGSSLSRVRVVVGPHIGPCCYEVGADCLEAFKPADLHGAVAHPGPRPHLALAAVLARQAARAGLAADQVDSDAPCTRCHVNPDGAHPYASYRRAVAEGFPAPQSNVAYIAVTGTG